MDKRRKGILLILSGIVLITGSVFLTICNFWNNDRAGKASEQILRAIDEEIVSINPTKPSSVPPAETFMNSYTELFEDDSESPSETSLESNDQERMHTITVGNFNYIGTIEIPSLGIRLPVMDSWSEVKLKYSPCLYSGSYQENNMVICGHNYRKHFSPIKQINLGADVYFVTVDIEIYHYTVCNRETVPPTSIQKMIVNMSTVENGSGAVENWHLTLFTCNPGGQTRCAVRCLRSGN